MIPRSMSAGRTSLACSLLGLLALPPARAQCHDLRDLDTLMQTAVNALSLPGISLQISQYGADVYERAFGGYRVDTVVPIASGSKWLAAAAILTLVDDGRIKLDDAAGRYLPRYATGALAPITIRMCLSHMSGLQSTDAGLGNQQITLAQAVDQVAQLPLQFQPDSTFFYGELGLQVAGRIAEVVSGRSWEAFFAERITQPLGMSSTGYGNVPNPHLGGGATSTLRDYGTFLKMLRNGGQHGARRILSPYALAEMTRDQTHGAPMSGWNPNGARYGLGCWRDRVDAAGRCLQLGSIGALGFTPWLDVERDVTGIMLVNDSIVRTYPLGLQVQTVTRNMLKPAGVTCVGAPCSCHRPIFANGTTVPWQGNRDFALRCDGAPPSAAGFVLLTLNADEVGTPLLGARLHVALDPLPLTFGVTSNASGQAFVPFPLVQTFREQSFATQFAWFHGPLCADPLGSSHGLVVVVQ
jgi:CubicO group peptidase (beta-lactamase class C family)